jgi:hypothetical protein
VVAVVGLTFVAAALAANQRWLDRHFLPSFFLPRHWYVLVEGTVRAAVASTGVLLAVVSRQWIGRAIGRAPGLALLVLMAVAAALGTSEIVLRQSEPRPSEWQRPDEEPLRLTDPLTGWVVAPSRTGRRLFGGRMVEYAIDSAGYRVRRADEPVDPASPTIVFAGESVMFGEGLEWSETVPAQVGAMLSIQSANLAVHGYTNDQVYLRLKKELPRFRQPLAVVTLFMTALFGRNLDKDRPYLTYSLGPHAGTPSRWTTRDGDPAPQALGSGAPGAGFLPSSPELGWVWHPAEHGSRLRSLAEFLVPYRSEQTVESGITRTREVLRATVELARCRGATPLIVVPQFGSEDRLEASLRTRVLDETMPSLIVTIDEDWHLPWDRHPNARAAHAIAVEVAARLRQELRP